MGLTFDPVSGRCLATVPVRDRYNPSLSTSDVIGLGVVAGLIITGIIIALIIFFIRRRKGSKNISEADQVEELELGEHHAGQIVSVENDFPL
jgi:hypothetical protein